MEVQEVKEVTQPQKIKLIGEVMAANMQQHIKTEQDSAQIYDAMGSWCAEKGYMNSSKYFYHHGDEERIHNKKVIEFIEDKDILAIIPMVDKPDNSTWKTIGDLIDSALIHEKLITDGWNMTATLSLKNADHDCYGFSLEFLKEQREEHVVFLNLFYKWKALDGCPGCSFFMDEYICKLLK